MSWGQGDWGQSSDRGLGVLIPCNATSGCKQKPCMTDGSQCSSVMTACPIKWGPRSVNTAVTNQRPVCLSVCLQVPVPRLETTTTTHTYTHTSFAVGGDGCPCPFSPRSGGGCKVMMSSSSGGFQMYCSPLPMNTASWQTKSIEELSQVLQI